MDFTANRATSSQRWRCAIGRLLAQLILLLSSSVIADESSNDAQNESATEGHMLRMEQYYFRHEIDFLARQAMILGNHPDAVRPTPTSTSEVQEEVNRLRFLEKALQIELDYIRRLRDIEGNPHKYLANAATATTTTNETNATNTESSHTVVDTMETMSDVTSNLHAEKRKPGSASELMINTINEATWPAWASLPTKDEHVPPQNIEMYDHIPPHDADWHEENGFYVAYDEFQCSEHAYDQKKPLYTPKMWSRLKEAFWESTLFPFPMPEPEEIPDEPMYADYTVDGKGRGIFASRNITKGELIHSGYPNTVFFLDASAWFRFVALLPKMMACDVMEWAWQQDLTDTGNVVMCLNLDEAVFFNDGGYDNTINMAMRETTSLDFYAIKDVAAGQELLYDYDHFVFETTEMNL